MQDFFLYKTTPSQTYVYGVAPHECSWSKAELIHLLSQVMPTQGTPGILSESFQLESANSEMANSLNRSYPNFVDLYCVYFLIKKL